MKSRSRFIAVLPLSVLAYGVFMYFMAHPRRIIGIRKEANWEKVHHYRNRVRASELKQRSCSLTIPPNVIVSSCLNNWQNYSYPADTDAHFEEIRTTLADFAQLEGHKPHFRSWYQGPWIENYWIDHFETMYDASNHCLKDIFGDFVPLFLPWEDVFVEHFSQYPQKMVKKLHRVLRPEVAYITVSQNVKGLANILPPDAFPNVLVLSAGGFGHVPIPLLKTPEKQNNRKEINNRPYFASFVGKLAHAPNSMREKLHHLLGKQNGIKYLYYYGNDWRDVMANSRFQLVPRGTGRNVFHLTESIQMGLIPIYVYTDTPWLPYEDLYRTKIGFATTLNKLPGLLQDLQSNMTDNEAQLREKNIYSISRSHFTLKGVMKQIGAFMIGKQTDLKCQVLPKSDL